MAKKKLPISIFEIVWYSICVLVIAWGLTYVILGLVNRFNDFTALKTFNNNFKSTFGLELYFWGLIIIGIAVIAGVIVLLVYAKTFDRASDREQRRSARLSALRKEEKVVDEQEAEVVNEPQAEEVKPAEEEKPAEPVNEEAAQ